MYPENKFEASLSIMDYIGTVAGMLILEAISLYAIWAMYPYLWSYIDQWSRLKLIGFGVSILIALYVPYYLYTSLKNAFSKWAALRIDAEGIFSKEDGLVPFEKIRDIVVIDKKYIKSGEVVADQIKIIHHDDTSTYIDIEDIDVLSEEIIKAYQHFQKERAKHQK